jgi:hypothetical protein
MRTWVHGVSKLGPPQSGEALGLHVFKISTTLRAALSESSGFRPGKS